MVMNKHGAVKLAKKGGELILHYFLVGYFSYPSSFLCFYFWRVSFILGMHYGGERGVGGD